jgi:hypothetical protein
LSALRTGHLYTQEIFLVLISVEARDGVVVKVLRYKPGRSRVRFPMVSLEFFSDIILRSHYDPGVDSASNRNEYQVYFLGVKTAGAKG